MDPDPGQRRAAHPPMSRPLANANAATGTGAGAD
jgi:hypothetical protein